MAYGKREIDRLIDEGFDAIAFDFIGYNNYYACYCPTSQEKYKQYCAAHSELSHTDAIHRYSRDCLVTFNNTLIDYARNQKPRIIMTTHIYPCFAPDPLYGNHISVDYCGQTAAWFFQPHWSFKKIRTYSNEIAKDGTKYYSHAIGAPFIGVYTLPPYAEHRKSPERLREEIRLIKQSGSKAIQMAELGNILSDPTLAAVVREELQESSSRIDR